MSNLGRKEINKQTSEVIFDDIYLFDLTILNYILNTIQPYKNKTKFSQIIHTLL
jgi:hypothetical protein